MEVAYEAWLETFCDSRDPLTVSKLASKSSSVDNTNIKDSIVAVGSTVRKTESSPGSEQVSQNDID